MNTNLFSFAVLLISCLLFCPCLLFSELFYRTKGFSASCPQYQDLNNFSCSSLVIGAQTSWRFSEERQLQTTHGSVLQQEKCFKNLYKPHHLDCPFQEQLHLSQRGLSRAGGFTLKHWRDLWRCALTRSKSQPLVWNIHPGRLLGFLLALHLWNYCVACLWDTA